MAVFKLKGYALAILLRPKLTKLIKGIEKFNTKKWFKISMIKLRTEHA